jgi:hypothetical protein
MPEPRDTNALSAAHQVRAIPKKKDRPDVYPAGRACIDCEHALSIYNPGPDCNACALAHVVPIRSPRAELLECMRQAA